MSMDASHQQNNFTGGQTATVMSITPKFDISNWNPEGPASLQFMSLLAVDGGATCDEMYEQKPHTNKIRISIENRKQRRRSNQDELRKDGMSLLNAVTADDFAKVRDLVQTGSDVNYADERKRTSLHVTAAKGNVAILDLLLKHGADPNKKDILENTPLHLAACVANIPIITQLLKAGARVDSLDRSRRSPLHLARGRLRMLQKNWDISTHQFKMEINQVIEMMKQYLVSSGADPSQLDTLCEQLHDTSTRQDEEAFNKLLDEFTGLNIDKNEPD